MRYPRCFWNEWDECSRKFTYCIIFHAQPWQRRNINMNVACTSKNVFINTKHVFFLKHTKNMWHTSGCHWRRSGRSSPWPRSSPSCPETVSHPAFLARGARGIWDRTICGKMGSGKRILVSKTQKMTHSAFMNKFTIFEPKCGPGVSPIWSCMF